MSSIRLQDTKSICKDQLYKIKKTIPFAIVLKKNKILRNKFTKISVKLYSENYTTLLKKNFFKT